MKIIRDSPFCYLTKAQKIFGTSFKDVEHRARFEFNKIKSQSRRTPYVKSKYFNNEKIFITLFWSHLFEKHEKERTKRLKFFICALDTVKNSKIVPTHFDNPLNKKETLYRFYGKTKNGEIFITQIKENKKSGKKYLMSCFPL